MCLFYGGYIFFFNDLLVCFMLFIVISNNGCLMYETNVANENDNIGIDAAFVMVIVHNKRKRQNQARKTS